MQRSHLYPMAQALLAAALFGASAPFAKVLLGDMAPVLLAALLYLGSGVGVLLYKPMVSRRQDGQSNEARIQRSDWPWLAGAVLAGGVAAPILLLIGLRTTPAATASLLLNFEVVATAIIAALIFKEAVSRRALWGILAVTTASIILSWDTSGEWGFSLGALAILAACVLWGVDNNLTRNISAKDPLTIVLVKGFGAGSLSLALALVLGADLPAIGVIVGALLLGAFSYGMSIVLFIRALRGLGAARTGALFGTAPLVGMVISLLLFQEAPTNLWIALPFVLLATLLLLTEKHSHEHRHEAVTHEHRHRHDDGHHNHQHPGTVDRGFEHSHAHLHELLVHEHSHLPDIHHRHPHPAD